MAHVVEHTRTQVRSKADARTSRKDDEVRDYFRRFAKALTQGDAKTIATMWSVPALVMSDQGSKAVRSKDEVEQFFGGAKEQYTERGINEAIPTIKRVDWITPKMVLVHVRWPYIDTTGKEIGSESSVYTLLRGEDGSLTMACVMMQGEEQRSEAV